MMSKLFLKIAKWGGLIIVNSLLFIVPFLWDQFFFLIFGAFALLFKISGQLKRTAWQLLYSFAVILLWQSGIMHWMHSYAILWWASILAILFLCVLTFLPFFLYFSLINRLRIAEYAKYLLFSLVWLFFEWQSFEWDLTYPFHTLGYYLGNVPPLIQWYACTGVLGGTLWILLLNWTVLCCFNNKLSKSIKWGYIIMAVVPILLSVVMYCFPLTAERTEKLLAVNIKKEKDCTTCGKDYVFNNVLDQLYATMDSAVFLAVCPETVCHLPATSFPYNSYFSAIKRLIKQLAPQATVLFGAATQDVQGEVPFHDKRYFNMALSCDATGWTGFRNKMRLVPFGEFFPYSSIFNKIIDTDSIVSYPFTYKKEYDTIIGVREVQVLPLICYELYFTNLIGQQLRKNKVQLLVAISNDYIVAQPIFARQFIRMAKVQAVSFRKTVVKSAMYGVSFIIAPKGELLTQSGYNTSEVISAEAPINSHLTPFGQYGNSVAYLLWLILFFVASILHYYEKKTVILNPCT